MDYNRKRFGAIGEFLLSGVAGEVYMTQILAHGISTDMNYPALIVLFVIVLVIWLRGQTSPKIKHLRVSAVVSFILLSAAAILLSATRGSGELSLAVVIYAFMLIILCPGWMITWLIWEFLSAADFRVSINDDSFWVCILVFSFVINAFVIFWITRIASYICKKRFTAQANAS